MNDPITPLSISKRNDNSLENEFPDKAWSLSKIHDSSPHTAVSIHKDISTNPLPPRSPSPCPSPSILEFGFATSNLPQLFLHWILAALIGTSLRTTTFPQALIAADMGVNNYTRETSFLVAFGFTKALSNLVVGWASDRYGRKVPHVFGWGAGLVLASLLLSADRSFGSSSSSSAADDAGIDDPTKGWTRYVIADIFLGVQQGFTWTTNVFLFTDVLGPEHRALASGVSNATGYLASAGATYLAAGIGVDRSFEVVMLCSVLGVALSVFAMEDTTNFVGREVMELEKETEVIPEEEEGVGCGDDVLVAAGDTIGGGGTAAIDTTNCVAEKEDGMFPKDTLSQIETTSPLPSTQSFRTTFTTTSYHNKSTAVLCLGGLVTNLVTSLSWGLVTIWAKQQSLPSHRLATLNATFTIAKAVSQLLIGYASDRLPTRRPVLVAGFSTVALGLAITAAADSAHHLDGVYSRLLYGGILTGTGVGSVYCVMTGAVGDHTHPSARAGAVGVYKLWRDGGYAVGGLGTGLIADAAGGSFGISVGCVGMVVVVTVVVIAMGYGEAVRSGGESRRKKRMEREEWHEIRNLEDIT